MSMSGSLFGSTVADVLKSESCLRLLKLGIAIMQTPGYHESPGTIFILIFIVIWQARPTGSSIGFQRISEAARVCGQTGL
jgi:hypothetical protein